MMMDASEHLAERVEQHLAVIYQDVLAAEQFSVLTAQLIETMRLNDVTDSPQQYQNHWSEQDAILITYGDSIQREGEKPLVTLKRFLTDQVKQTFNSVHLLPFYPWSSDDGFSVMDYSSVNESLGEWVDVNAIAQDYRVMADLVVNHCSARGHWYQNFIKGEEPGKNYFFTASPADDLSDVVRPRTSSLLREEVTANGTQHVWCTFSQDQVDLDFRNPEVLIQFISIIRLYLDQGVKIFRLDAIAFLWKIVGTNCLNLPQTHEMVRLFRTLIEYACHDAVIITETNIPNRENLSYFGNSNEAHCVYNFSLPPLLVHALLTSNSQYLKQWMMSMPPAQMGTTYFNFIASHDGIGLRPVEGLLAEAEVEQLISTIEGFGGRVSYRDLAGGGKKPYEMNITLYDALKGTVAGEDDLGFDRFICAHAIMFGLEGIPGVYIHSVLGTRNDYKRMENTGHNRAINRHQWDDELLQQQLADDSSINTQVMQSILSLLTIRKQQPAFHPNATQFTLHLGEEFFGFWRQSMDRRQSIFCISNISDQPQQLALSAINLIDNQAWVDLISGVDCSDNSCELTLAPYQTLWVSNVMP